MIREGKVYSLAFIVGANTHIFLLLLPTEYRRNETFRNVKSFAYFFVLLVFIVKKRKKHPSAVDGTWSVERVKMRWVVFLPRMKTLFEEHHHRCVEWMKKYLILTMEIVYCYEQMPEEQLCLAARAAGLGTSPKPDLQPHLEHGNCRRLVAFTAATARECFRHFVLRTSVWRILVLLRRSCVAIECATLSNQFRPCWLFDLEAANTRNYLALWCRATA